MEVKIKRLSDTAVIPKRQTRGSAGADLFADIDRNAIVHPNETKVFKTGLAFEIPEGYVGLIFARSGLATKEGLVPSTCVSVIDSDYRGDVLVGIRNLSTEIRMITPKERIAQLVIVPYCQVDYLEAEELSDTERGNGGFGSTGK